MMRLSPFFLLASLATLAGCSSAVDETDSSDDAIGTSCRFRAGALAHDTIKSAPKSIPIKHVIILMQENRSFDHMLGSLARMGKDVDGIPEDFVNEDDAGKKVHFTHRSNTCFPSDAPHNSVAMTSSVNGDEMDNFVKSASNDASDGHFVMSYYTNKELPFYYFLAQNYSISDRYFAAMIGPTWPNRDFMYAATSNGKKETRPSQVMTGVKTIFDAMDENHVSWGVYSNGNPRQDTLGWDAGHRGFHATGSLFKSLKDGTLPEVVFVDPGPSEDEHPPHNVQDGERLAKLVYDGVINSPQWNEIALFYTYDEAGGIADHVSPPPACAPSPELSDFNRLGVRVPVMLVSPYAKRDYVSHQTHSHTSILRFIELIHNMPALTGRDANADAMLDMFDFSKPVAPAPHAPATGIGGCSTDSLLGKIEDRGKHVLDGFGIHL